MACRQELGHAQGQLPFAKFDVSYVLLHSGFDNVVLSEIDVFFFESPLPTFKECTQGGRSTWAS